MLACSSDVACFTRLSLFPSPIVFLSFVPTGSFSKDVIKSFRTLKVVNIVANSLSDHKPLKEETEQAHTNTSKHQEIHSPHHVVVIPGKTNSDPEKSLRRNGQ